jgi:predicted DNA-binding transcriptional regulator AlpA
MIPSMTEELVSLPEVGRRVGLSAQRIRQLADEDPTFPARRKVGRVWAVVWPEAERYFATRQPKPGRPRRESPVQEGAKE